MKPSQALGRALLLIFITSQTVKCGHAVQGKRNFLRLQKWHLRLILEEGIRSAIWLEYRILELFYITLKTCYRKTRI